MLDWNSLTPALKDPTRLPDLSQIGVYRHYLIETFKKHAVKDLRLIFQHYFSEFAKKLESHNAVHYKNQMRLYSKHPAVDRVIQYILNDPNHSECLGQAAQTGDLLTCLEKSVYAYFEEQGDDWLVNQFELSDYERPEISRPQFMSRYIKLCQSGHRREVWRALQDFSAYMVNNDDLLAEYNRDPRIWQYRSWLHSNFK